MTLQIPTCATRVVARFSASFPLTLHIVAFLAMIPATISAQRTGSDVTGPIGGEHFVASAVLSSPISCHGGLAQVNVSASGGTAPYSGTGLMLRTAGTHTFIVTDASDRKAIVAMTITEPLVLFANASLVSNESACGASDAITRIRATGGTPPYAGVGKRTGLTAGSPEFVITDENGCMTKAVLDLPEPDRDGDGTADCGDECPEDPLKTRSGQCGCGEEEHDQDGDTYADCVDECPQDPLKSSPGTAGCGQVDGEAPPNTQTATIVGSEPANLRIWPNPLRDGDLNVLLGGLKQDETSAQLTMIDLQGRTIADQRIAAQGGFLNVQLTADEHLPTGTYLITIRTTGRSWTERVIVG